MGWVGSREIIPQHHHLLPSRPTHREQAPCRYRFIIDQITSKVLSNGWTEAREEKLEPLPNTLQHKRNRQGS